MRYARKLLLFAVMAMAALVLGASSASAQTVEIINEADDSHCPALTPTGGGCPIHAEGEVALQGHFFGIEETASDCHVELEGEVNAAGEGKVRSAVFTDHPGVNDCTRTACALPWHVDVTEEGGMEWIESEFCVVNTGTGGIQRCHAKGELHHTFGAHDYEVPDHGWTVLNHENAPNCELEGELHLETDVGEPHVSIGILHPGEEGLGG